MSPHLGVQHEWIKGQCSLTLSPGAELPVLHGSEKHRRLKETNNTVVKVLGKHVSWILTRGEKAQTKMSLLREKQLVPQGFKMKNGGEKVKNTE